MRNLSDAECGRLFRALLEYSSGADTPINLQGREAVAFDFMRVQIDRDSQAYQRKCEKYKENQAKRGTKSARKKGESGSGTIDNNGHPLITMDNDGHPLITMDNDGCQGKGEGKGEGEGENNITETSFGCPDTADAARDDRPKKPKKPPPTFEPEHYAYRGAAWLAKRILERYPNHKPYAEKDLQRWARDIDKINRIDGYDWRLISKVLLFSQDDHFWQANVLSGDTFRKNFDKLMAAMEREDGWDA